MEEKWNNKLVGFFVTYLLLMTLRMTINAGFIETFWGLYMAPLS